MAILQSLALIPAIIALVLFIRIRSVLPTTSPRAVQNRVRGSPTYLLVVLGSGGHTAEMFMLLRNLDSSSYTFRRYVVSSGDTFSAAQAIEFEDKLARTAASTGRSLGSYDIRFVPRARRIHQSLLSTPFSASTCMLECFRLLQTVPSDLRRKPEDRSTYPDLIITNGPATATILLFASFILRVLLPVGNFHQMRCVYVESWARVKKMSLSGRILKKAGICDRILVQWPSLLGKGTEYQGQLIA